MVLERMPVVTGRKDRVAPVHLPGEGEVSPGILCQSDAWNQAHRAHHNYQKLEKHPLIRIPKPPVYFGSATLAEHTS